MSIKTLELQKASLEAMRGGAAAVGMRDTLYSGRVFRTLNVIDEANRGALGIDVAVSIPATRVTTFLAQMIDLHGRPTAIRCDNGPS